LELKPSIKERILKAFMDLIILRALKKQPMTAYEINHHFLKEFGTQASPSTIYRTLTAMERNRWIKCVRNRHGKAYAPTEKGQETLNKITSITAEIQTSIKTLLGT
jgi:DNA-binding PadR family transcriptional regulator